ncbi:hypothetical protein NQ652_17700, partial [Acinetobacter baumannii]|nr:hypothetical protein [Acinetobacter baumannii]
MPPTAPDALPEPPFAFSYVIGFSTDTLGLDAVFNKGKNVTVDDKGTYQALSLDFGGKSTFKARDNVEVILS